MSNEDDELLVARLRELSLVDLDALLGGSAGEHQTELLIAHADDLADALRIARGRARELLEIASGGPDPLALVDASFEMRGREEARGAAERVARRLAARAQACRALARMDDLCARLFPRLVEADRRRASLGAR